MTEWKKVSDFEDYEVSSDGRVRRATKGQGTVQWQEIKRHTQTSNGYPNVRLRKNGKTHTVSVHTLVASAFLGPRPDGLQIRHLDGDRMNASSVNLCYGTAHENAADKIRHGKSFFTGTSNPKSKLSIGQVKEIRELRSAGTDVNTICLRYGLARSTVYRIANGTYWKEA